MMWRWLYRIVWHALIPLTLLKLWRRGKHEPAYRQHMGERFGFYPQRLSPQLPVIWLHAVSLGETRAAQPLILQLRQQFPEHHLLITSMTATGREAATTLYGDFATIATLPYDLPWALARFIRHFHPQIGLIMETEVWPELCYQAVKHQVPIALVNARLSAKSAKGYQRFAGLTRPAFTAFSLVCAQTRADAERLAIVGARQPMVTGNLKFDVPVNLEQITLGKQLKQWLANRPVFLFASSRDGEEALLLAAWKAASIPNEALLLIVPRHPQRFEQVAAEIAKHGFASERRSAADWERPIPDSIQVVLGDSMGEMSAYYTASDICLIGGSITPLGGQNLIEAAAYGCPLLVGPHMFNFAEANREALAAGAAMEIQGAEDAVNTALLLLSNPNRLQTMQAHCHTFANAHRGATTTTIEAINTQMMAA